MSHPNTSHRSIKADYLSGSDTLKAFYKYSPQNPSFEQIISDKSFSKDKRKKLYQALTEQYQGFDLPSSLRQNLESLREANTWTLTTGHQLGLMGGPLFTVYKVMSTISLADKLRKQQPEHNFVPVFWIHTEDHDFEEINHFYSDFGKKHTYKGQFESATGLHILDESILDLIPENFDQKLKDAWKPGQTLAQAYRKFFHELMGEAGLVILDAAHPLLKESFKPVLEREIFGGLAFQAVGKTSAELESAGYKLQIHPREINLFYLDEKGRNRIEATDDGFVAMDRNLSWTADEMRELIAHEPTKFSPNVSLRPLYQEVILPNLAYFGGWGELSYWVQLKGLFEEAGENFPLLLPRFSATLFPEEKKQEWTELGLELADVTKSQALINKLMVEKVWDDAEFEARRRDVLEAIEKLENYIGEDLSETLSQSAQALGTKSGRFMDNLHKKAHRVIRNDRPKLFEKIVEIKSGISPDRLVQERVWSLASLNMSPRMFVKWLGPLCIPAELSHQILVLPEQAEPELFSQDRREESK